MVRSIRCSNWHQIHVLLFQLFSEDESRFKLKTFLISVSFQLFNRFTTVNGVDVVNIQVVVQSAAKKSYHNHNLEFKHRSNCFCDCGAGDLPVHCNAMKFPHFNYLSSCTNREQKYQKKMQRLYYCFTCGLTAENQGICEACPIHCHNAHKLVYVGMKKFACECLLVNLECKAPSCPEVW